LTASLNISSKIHGKKAILTHTTLQTHNSRRVSHRMSAMAIATPSCPPGPINSNPKIQIRMILSNKSRQQLISWMQSIWIKLKDLKNIPK
jgi:hypothetical protein